MQLSGKRMMLPSVVPNPPLLPHRLSLLAEHNPQNSPIGPWTQWLLTGSFLLLVVRHARQLFPAVRKVMSNPKWLSGVLKYTLRQRPPEMGGLSLLPKVPEIGQTGNSYRGMLQAHWLRKSPWGLLLSHS